MMSWLPGAHESWIARQQRGSIAWPFMTSFLLYCVVVQRKQFWETFPPVLNWWWVGCQELMKVELPDDNEDPLPGLLWPAFYSIVWWYKGNNFEKHFPLYLTDDELAARSSWKLKCQMTTTIRCLAFYDQLFTLLCVSTKKTILKKIFPVLYGCRFCCHPFRFFFL